jgi:hypothetical protein
MKKVDLILYSIAGCAICEALKALLQKNSESPAFQGIQVSYCHYTDLSSASPQATPDGAKNLTIRMTGRAQPDIALMVSPRMFPTVVAFVEGIPKAGWEGFAAMSPHEIQDASVLEVLHATLHLASDSNPSSISQQIKN